MFSNDEIIRENESSNFMKEHKWTEVITGIKFDKIASIKVNLMKREHFKNYLTDMLIMRQLSLKSVDEERYTHTTTTVHTKFVT